MTDPGPNPDRIFVVHGDQVFDVEDPVGVLLAVPVGRPEQGKKTSVVTYVSGDAQTALRMLVHLAETMTKRGMPLAALKIALDHGYRIGQYRLVHGEDAEVTVPMIQVVPPGDDRDPEDRPSPEEL